MTIGYCDTFAFRRQCHNIRQALFWILAYIRNSPDINTPVSQVPTLSSFLCESFSAVASFAICHNHPHSAHPLLLLLLLLVPLAVLCPARPPSTSVSSTDFAPSILQSEAEDGFEHFSLISFVETCAKLISAIAIIVFGSVKNCN